MKEKYNICLMSLGCDKNRVDSEIMLGILKGKHKIVLEPSEADIIIVNTCGFIDTAKEESINTILEAAEYKKDGKCKLLMATGCLTQRFGEELYKEIPELDVILGVNSYPDLDHYIEEYVEKGIRIIDTKYTDKEINSGERVITTSFGASAFLRIGEGCSMNCTYCIIPKIRGKYRSRSLEEILHEAKKLESAGVKELIVIAQDTTMYGVDLYKEKRLHEVLDKLSSMDFKWIRVMYMYPEGIYDELLEVMSKKDNILNYFDMPIQHVSNRVLKLMGRRTNRKTIEETLEKIKEKMPNAVLRTTFITGFPTETEEDLEEILSFLKKMKLDKVGAFTYSREEGTPAALMEGQIDDDIKEDRLEKLMLSQQIISKEKNEEKLNKTFDVLVETFDGENYRGRSWEMAPEIDGEIIIDTKKQLICGDFRKVTIVDFDEYDLKGEILNESSK